MYNFEKFVSDIVSICIYPLLMTNLSSFLRIKHCIDVHVSIYGTSVSFSFISVLIIFSMYCSMYLQILELNSRYNLSESKDYEVKVAFLLLAIASKCKDHYAEVEKTLKAVGRKKYLVPLYTALVEGAGKEEEKILAKRVFAEARETYHPIAQSVIETILSKHI